MLPQELRTQHADPRTIFLVITHNPDSLFHADAHEKLVMRTSGRIGTAQEHGADAKAVEFVGR
jgi:hypothetical protein